MESLAWIFGSRKRGTGLGLRALDLVPGHNRITLATDRHTNDMPTR